VIDSKILYICMCYSLFSDVISSSSELKLHDVHGMNIIRWSGSNFILGRWRHTTPPTLTIYTIIPNGSTISLIIYYILAPLSLTLYIYICSHFISLRSDCRSRNITSNSMYYGLRLGLPMLPSLVYYSIEERERRKTQPVLYYYIYIYKNETLTENWC
jgi:hypothetical protein